ncbi:MAG: aminodeoxychorismate lyase [Gammaproteobacteria bacterium RBG_16_57_12]|nr:MAG: aminodeoxychorismate lyase [Gammaproteobacteria bacterium RBG_16_57_12]
MFLINGLPGDALPLQDRGLHYGDGLFETLAIDGGKPRLWPRHMARLVDGCSRLRIPPPDQEVLARELTTLCEGQDAAVIKIIITRGSGGRGYQQPQPLMPTRIVARYPWPAMPDAPRGIAVRLCETRLGHNPRLAGIKHLNRLEQVLARAEWDNEDIQEGLLRDQDGYIIEGISSNVFLVMQGILYTPSLKECGVDGVMRNLVMDAAHELNLSCKSMPLSLEHLYEAQEVFLTNSLFGIRPVRTIVNIGDYDPGDITQRVQHKVSEMVL